MTAGDAREPGAVAGGVEPGGIAGGVEPGIELPALSRGTLDRSAARRHDEEWLAEAWSDPRTRVLVVDDGRTLVDDEPAGTGDAAARLVFLPPADVPDGERYLLGVEEATGVRYFAVAAPLPDLSPDGVPARPAGLRSVGALLSDRDAGILAHAVALQIWHARHPRCPRCGVPTRVTAGGHMRVCPDDGSQHFPRIDPAVIMLVHDGEDRCLLARQPSWPVGRFSTLAGFVEPGESLEQAVAREVSEEVGVPIVATRYAGSQPWPFPSSIMLGFFAEAGDHRITVDADEIAEACWLTREELRRVTEDGSMGLPGRVSIARRLIEGWYGGPLAGSW